MITALIIAIVLVAGLYFLLKKAPLVDDNGVIVQEKPTEEPLTNIEDCEVIGRKIEETKEDLEKRLESLKNPDADKPFAKMSVPTPSEFPIDPTPAPKKKKPYKKKKAVKPATEAPVVETPVTSAPETVTESEKPKKKRPYKKRAPKKEE
jgi:hypothetical protein